MVVVVVAATEDVQVSADDRLKSLRITRISRHAPTARAPFQPEPQ